jgi:transposase
MLRRSARSPCTRPRPQPRARCAPHRRAASTATTNAPGLISRGQRTACACSCASASGSVAIAPAVAASSLHGYPPWPPPGLGVALGGTAGVHLSQQWGLAVSRNTLLHWRRSLPVPSLPPPTVLGVEDFALRKRQTYGTALIDLERRPPVALLPERTAATVAHWRQEHPGVEVIARDRSSASAEGARQGASAATQGADRCHVLQNHAEALHQGCATQSHALDTVQATWRQQPVPLPDGVTAVPVLPRVPPCPAQQRAAQRQAPRQALQTQVWA